MATTYINLPVVGGGGGGGGVTSLNSLTGALTLTLGTTGTNPSITSAGNSLVINLPSSSATNRGLLTSADWSTFNSKQAALGYTPEDVANKAIDFSVINDTLYPSVKAVNNQIASSLSGYQTYVFSSAASDISTYLQMPVQSLYTPGTIATNTVAASTTPALMRVFATNTGYPNSTAILPGLFTIHFETQKDAGPQGYYAYAQVYQRTSGGVETLLTTSDNTSTTSVNSLVQQTVTAEITSSATLASTDRIVVKLYVVMISNTSNITISYDDNTNSRIQFPVISLGYIPEDVANKATSTSLGTSNVLYPTQNAVKVYVDTGLSAKQNTITGAATTIVSSDLTASRALISDASGKVAVSTVTSTTLAFLDATSSIQTQLNGKQDTSAKGVASGYASLDASGLVPITQIPPAALERLVIVADQTARYALTTATVQNGDTVKQVDINQMFFVSDDTNLNNASGYTVYSAGTAASVPWSGITSIPTPVSSLSGTNTGDVTIGTANGLSLASQALSLGTASTSTTGALTSTDWNTFNNKQATLTGATSNVVSTNLNPSIVVVSDASGKLGSSTVSTTTLGYLDATSSIQTQLNGKQATVTGAATTGVTSNLATSRAMATDASGKMGVATTTYTELNYVSGVTSSIQTQLNGKQATITGAASTVVTSNLSTSVAVVSDGSGKIASSSVTATELGYLSGATSNIQTQLNALGSPTIPDPVGTFHGYTFQNNSTSISSNDIAAGSATGTVGAVSVATTNVQTRQVRMRFSISTPAANAQCGYRSSNALWSVNGGFLFQVGFAYTDTGYNSGAIQFYGLTATTTALTISSTVSVSSLFNQIGIGSDAGDTALSIYTNAGSGASTKITLSATDFPANRTAGTASTDIFFFELYNAVGSNNVNYRVTNITTGVQATGVLSSNLPANTTLLAFQAMRTSGSTSNQGNMDLTRMGCYSIY